MQVKLVCHVVCCVLNLFTAPSTFNAKNAIFPGLKCTARCNFFPNRDTRQTYFYPRCHISTLHVRAAGERRGQRDHVACKAEMAHLVGLSDPKCGGLVEATEERDHVACEA